MFNSSQRNQSFYLIVSPPTTLICVTSWVMRFTRALRNHASRDSVMKSPLTVKELVGAEMYWISVSQGQSFCSELKSLFFKKSLPSSSSLCTLHPFLDTEGTLRVRGRTGGSKLAYSMMHPIILNSKHPLTRLIIRAEHIRLLHAGPTLVMSSLNPRNHIIGGRRVVRSITRACVTCRRPYYGSIYLHSKKIHCSSSEAFSGLELSWL